MDVVTAFANAGRHGHDHRRPLRPGLQGHASRVQIFAVYDELTKDEPKRQFTIGIVDDVTHLSLHGEAVEPPTPPRKAPSSASSGASAATAPSARTRTPSRSSATTPISMSRLTSSTTPRRPAASPSATCASATSPSRARTTSTRPTSSPATTRPTSCKDFPMVQRRQARRHLPHQLPVGLRGARQAPATPTRSATSPRTTCSSTPSTPSTSPSRSAWASAPTPSCRPRSSLWPTCMPKDEAVKYMKDAADALLHEEGHGRCPE